MRIQFVLICVSIVFFTSCESRLIKNNFNPEIFSNNLNQSAICFDLSEDQRIHGGLILKQKTTGDSIIRDFIIIPIEVDQMDRKLSIYSSYSTYNSNTIIDYSLNKQEATIGFTPRWCNTKDKPSNIYLVSSGLRRSFSYNHRLDQIDQKFLSKAKTVSYAGVKLPKNSKVFESKNKEIEHSVLNIDSTRFFNLNKHSEVELEYLVEAAPSQKKFSDLLLKIAGILLIPILQFVLFDKQLADEKRKTALKWFLRITIAIQILLFILIGYFIYSGFKNGEEINYSDLMLLIIVGLSESIVLWIKKGSK